MIATEFLTSVDEFRIQGVKDPVILAVETPFTTGEVDSLYELFKKLSSSIIDDGLIHKEEFQFALFRNRNKKNLFADRAFNEADSKGDGRIDQEEWKEFVSNNPSLIKNTTLPFLKDITLAFPSFIVSSETEESEI